MVNNSFALMQERPRRGEELTDIASESESEAGC